MVSLGYRSDVSSDSGTSSIDDRDRERTMSTFAYSKVRSTVDGGPTIGTSFITVLVGDDQKPFAVHEGLLLTGGQFFKAALSHDWKEKQDRTVKLPDCQPSTFNIYAKWLYSGQVCVVDKQEEEEAAEREMPLDFSPEWLSLKQSYIMADYVQSTDFKDAVLDAMIEKMINEDKCPARVIELIYSRTTDESPHRKVVHDLMLKAWKADHYQELRALDLSQEDLLQMLITVGKAYASTGGYRYETPIALAFRFQNPCSYHEHTLSGAACYRAKYNR